MKQILNIISSDNGVGLSRDIKIVTDLLSSVYDVKFSKFDRYKPFNIIRSDINLFIEIVDQRWFRFAKRNYLIPNPEWFYNEWVRWLPLFKMVFVKTRHAELIFSNNRAKARYISFTSFDRLKPGINKNYNSFFHLAGRSDYKNTDAVIRCWYDNPGFPDLIVVRHPGKSQVYEDRKNLKIISKVVEDDDLKDLQNSCGVHLCPSKAEGFGHYIMEACSTGSLILTTNAPPMNELITNDRGVLCNFSKQSKIRLSTEYSVEKEEIAQSVRRIINMSDDEKKLSGAKARQFFESNDQFFRKTFLELIQRCP